MSVQLYQMHLKHFRCFDNFHLSIDAPIMIIEGANGIGKTAILEALYYGCYLRSFRTHNTKELIAFEKEGFFIKVDLHDDVAQLSHTIGVGFSHNRRLIKVDQRTVLSYKDLMSFYKVLSITEDDLAFVKGGPQQRRSLIDQFLLLTDPSYSLVVRTYRQLVDQRNALLSVHNMNRDTYDILTQQLWEKSRAIQVMRKKHLELLWKQVNLLRETYLKDVSISFRYLPKVELYDSIDLFLQENSSRLYAQEKRYKRTLFGAHLDDILILFQDQPSRIFASRGQQKLIVFLIKMAQLKFLAQQGNSVIFLLDDFMTDFDQEWASILLNALQELRNQLIFTSPSSEGFLSDQLVSRGGQIVKLPY